MLGHFKVVQRNTRIRGIPAPAPLKLDLLTDETQSCRHYNVYRLQLVMHTTFSAGNPQELEDSKETAFRSMCYALHQDAIQLTHNIADAIQMGDANRARALLAELREHLSGAPLKEKPQHLGSRYNDYGLLEGE